MIGNSIYFEGLTLLITHYNRIESLKRLLAAFKDQQYSFEEIVVSDDGSSLECLKQLGEIQNDYNFRLITTACNAGLGNNLNKGQDAVRTPLTLYVQEDFVPKPLFMEKLQKAVVFMNEKPELDMVRFYAYFKYPSLKKYKDGFSQMKFSSNPLLSYRKFYFYSDHPHLRRSNFLQKFGRYTEGVKGDITEYKMMMSFLKKRGKSLYFDDFKGLFDQINSFEEPSTMKRNFWRNSRNPGIRLLRHFYRHVRFNFDLFL